MDITPISTSLPCEIPSRDLTVLEGHTSEVWIYPCIVHFLRIFNSSSMIEVTCYFIPGRFLPVHGVHQVPFLHLGEYIVFHNWAD